MPPRNRIALLFAAGASLVFAQDPHPGDIAGSAVDAQGGLAGMTIVLLKEFPPPQMEYHVRTSRDGNFRHTGLPPGRYVARLMAGARVLSGKKSIVVTSNQTTEVRFDVSKQASGGGAPVAVSRIRVGGNVMEGRILQRVQPVYPRPMLVRRIDGRVVLAATIGTAGEVLDLQVLSSPDPMLADAAMAAVRQWRYDVTMVNGVPAEVLTQVTVPFVLPAAGVVQRGRYVCPPWGIGAGQGNCPMDSPPTIWFGYEGRKANVPIDINPQNSMFIADGEGFIVVRHGPKDVMPGPNYEFRVLGRYVGPDGRAIGLLGGRLPCSVLPYGLRCSLNQQGTQFHGRVMLWMEQ